jgi:hypothetical protein
MELDLRIHEDNIQYKVRRDQQVLDNARLAFLNQGEVVAAISNLADAIWASRGTTTTGPIAAMSEPKSATAGTEGAPPMVGPASDPPRLF